MTPEEFKDARKRLGLTQPQLAAGMGVSESTIQRIEAGPEDVPVRDALAITALASSGWTGIGAEIAGLTYRRAPMAGETLAIGCWGDGNAVWVEVRAGRDLIAFDQIVLASKPGREDASRGKRESLAKKAAAHWRAAGFDVDLAGEA